jgi:hypothetical protein
MLPNQIRNKLKEVIKIKPNKMLGNSDARIEAIDNIINEAILSNPECFQEVVVSETMEKLGVTT